MKLEFLACPMEERRLFLEQAAIRRGLSPVILEKDFWVCWLLGLLFGSEFESSLVFKGAHHCRRFSASLTGSRKTSTCHSHPHSSSCRTLARAAIRPTSG